jgi:phosphohistidine swiveling domain-containing protein
MTTNILWFDDPAATDVSLVGGKGANLARLTQGSFAVPPGFCITTTACASFLAGTGIDVELTAMIGELDHDDPAALDALTGRMRALITNAPLPQALADEITGSLATLGAEHFVAVRSSATAEDLAEASFAGLHDSYLDVRGVAELLDAVKACWASLWTGRAAVYRHAKGFDHGSVGISVVVQQMVEAEVSGVVFTANPITTATDEMVINASYGLGESIVQGIVTPDEYTLKTATLRVVNRTLGPKAVRTVRDPATGVGTTTEPVPDAMQRTHALDDQQLTELGRLARRVQSHYGEVPQDIEWAFADGQLHLLQSRPVTGVEFSWDADVDEWQSAPDDPDIVWTRGFADEVWTGAVSPLMYSIRAEIWTRYGTNHMLKLLGDHRGGRAVESTRMWKFHKAEAYYNGTVDRGLIDFTPPPFRQSRLPYLTPDVHHEALAKPFSTTRYLGAQLGLLLQNRGQSVTGWFSTWFERIYDPDSIREADGLPDGDLADLPDRELQRYLDGMIAIEDRYWEEIYLGFLFHIVQAFGALGWMINSWYDGDNPVALLDLMTGSDKRTETQVQNHILWEISEEIRASATLSSLMEQHEGAAFFDALDASDDGRHVLALYRDFAARYPHRGHDDRDIAYPRRGDDPSVDYQFLRAFLSATEAADPAEQEEAANRRRGTAHRDVIANIESKTLGRLKAEAFKLVYDYVQRFIPARDDERDYADRYAYAWRRGFLEVGRRLTDRGLLAEKNDIFFLSRDEVYRLLGGNTLYHELTLSKIAARRRDFQRYYDREVTLPAYLQRDRPALLGTTQSSATGMFRGTATSRGTTTGTARIVKRLKDIGRVNAGEILVCNSTDPGWTPVFLVIAGIVTETGGINSHASCLSREYGFPSVQLADAMQLIPDGATITVDGDTGVVHLLDDAPAEKPVGLVGALD